MTTLPPEPSGSSVPETAIRDSHTYRQVAEGFGDDAARYDRARPSYPAELIDRIIERSPGREILDIGTGTGIVARLFQARGCQVLGVEPDPRMADAARRRGLEVEVAKAEDWDPAGRQFDAAVAGQVWHWVEPVAGAATAAKALRLPGAQGRTQAQRPGGRIALFWNVYQPEDKVRAAIGAVFARVDTGLPYGSGSASAASMVEGYLGMCRKAVDGMARAGGFGEPETWRFEWNRRYTRDEWLDMVPTMGGMSRVPAGKLVQLLDGIGAAIDSVGGGLTVNYTTVAVTAVRSA
ncbi:MAG TPA: class I SAM-dependent methyltransferase [Trebonia sp.]|jgi:SAM-dependent methyltransferase|nr:class I SAM-dependent methyltransferase [Trebonia sp.]